MDKSVNKVELKGRVGQDARIIRNENGTMAARFNLATNEIIKGRDDQLREETTWHNVVAWSRKGMPDFEAIRKGTFPIGFSFLNGFLWKNQKPADNLIQRIHAIRQYNSI